MSTWKKGYKVVRLYAPIGQLVGRTFWKHKVSYEVYKDYERIEGWGPFGCFNSLNRAREFSNPSIGDVVYHCLYVESEDRDFYCLDEDGNKRKFYGTPPPGTVFADKVILLDPVKERKVKGE